MMAVGVALVVVGVLLLALSSEWYMHPDGFVCTLLFWCSRYIGPALAIIGLTLILLSVCVFLWRTMP